MKAQGSSRPVSICKTLTSQPGRAMGIHAVRVEDPGDLPTDPMSGYDGPAVSTS